MGKYFIDTTQAEYWFQKLLGLSVQPDFIDDKNNVFVVKTFFIILFISLLWWLVREVWPGIIGAILSVVFFAVVVYLTHFYLRFFNKGKGLSFLILTLIPLFLIILI